MMADRLLISLCLLGLLSVTLVSADEALHAKLLAELNKDYHVLVPPDNVTLEAGLTFVCTHIETETHKLRSRVVERFHWVDSRLTWDPQEFGGIDRLSLPEKYVWKPDVKLQDTIVTEERDEVHVVVLSNGNVYWIPAANYKSLCSESDDKDDHTYHCQLRLGSWTYDAEALPMEVFEKGVDTQMYLDDCPYVVSNAQASIKSVKYDCCPNPFLSLVINFDVQEKGHGKDDDDDDHEEEEIHYTKDCKWPYCH